MADMKVVTDQTIEQHLRNVILLEADHLKDMADLFEQFVKRNSSRQVLEQRLQTSAIAMRERSKMLNTILEQSYAEAKAP